MWQRRKRKHEISNQSLWLVVVLAQFRSCQWCQLQHKAINSNRWTVALSSLLEITTFLGIWVCRRQMHCALWTTPTEPVCIDVINKYGKFYNTMCDAATFTTEKRQSTSVSSKKFIVFVVCLLWISYRPTHSQMVWLSSKSTCSFTNSMALRTFVILRSLHHTMQTSLNAFLVVAWKAFNFPDFFGKLEFPVNQIMQCK